MPAPMTMIDVSLVDLLEVVVFPSRGASIDDLFALDRAESACLTSFFDSLRDNLSCLLRLLSSQQMHSYKKAMVQFRDVFDFQGWFC